MNHNFAIDLRSARRKAGLTQEDCGHLLGGSRSAIKQLEAGSRLPTLTEICTLSLIFGRSFESLFGDLMAHCRRELFEKLTNLPEPEAPHAATFNRKHTLDALARRLATESSAEYDT
ncbi:helix-turn-helix transcriptional regulator [Leisingera sp. ANG59]|uniref:helix-turn-helix transcriptional regulator n=1 Tax=Leisingera sp. ANG59 TaxID=2675221 RepID=UPI0015729780|nr:helix-turn-helix transcriptional regulator [Leisingera sp. ANG59]NSY37538.1 helix-turn-helix domain-containing protein [Leisingera sp. ANG59]